jgi:phage repressor protein C with HTH and peptisase S24 domain
MTLLHEKVGTALSRQSRLFAVLVEGPSMAPTLRHGDALLIRRTSTGKPGAVAVVRFAAQRGLYVKRLSHEVDGGWWALGDNGLGSTDSRDYGPAEVVGRVLMRWWPKPSWVRSHLSLGKMKHGI